MRFKYSSMRFKYAYASLLLLVTTTIDLAWTLESMESTEPANLVFMLMDDVSLFSMA